MSDPFDRVRVALGERVRRVQADSLQARCPSHEDRNPSLSVKRGNDGVALINCFAGCRAEDVLSAIGLQMTDLYPERSQVTPRPQLVKTYTYRDLDGDARYYVHRYSPKTFRQQRATDNAWTMEGVVLVPYGLPELAGKKEVFITEGEKDADRLIALGVPATTNPGGAGKWSAELSETLSSIVGVQRVFIPADNDVAGRAHARIAAAHCVKAGMEARIVELPGLAEKQDVSDWLDKGGTPEQLQKLADEAPIFDPAHAVDEPAISDAALKDEDKRGRCLQLVPASSIAIRRVEWLWKERIALGALGLLGGREGIGKSILAYTLAASITQGKLEGASFGTKRSVVIVATEDSKAHTIVPRLMAAGADLDLVYFVTVDEDGLEADVVLPVDVPELTRMVREVDAALVLLDPLLSRLGASLDSHKDAEVRRGLEPLARLADETNTSILGLIHVNKSSSNDPLTMLMASRAFAAVARFVLFAMVDPDDEQKRLLGLAKSNLGRTDIPTQAYRIVPHCVQQTSDGGVWTGKLEWLGEHAGTIREAIHNTAASGDKSATTEAADWLTDYLAANGGSADSAEIKRAGAKAGHSADNLRRARERLRVQTQSVGFPRTTKWLLKDAA